MSGCRFADLVPMECRGRRQEDLTISCETMNYDDAFRYPGCHHACRESSTNHCNVQSGIAAACQKRAFR